MGLLGPIFLLLECAGGLAGALVLMACFLGAVLLVMPRFKGAPNRAPGPWGLPVVGYFPFLSDSPYLDFIELAKKYGDVFSVPLGSMRVLVLHSADVIREAYLKPEFLGRPPSSTLEIINPGSPFFADDMPLWRDQRRFVVRALKDLGLGRTVIEDAVQDEVGYLLKALSDHDGGAPTDIHDPLTYSISNNICALILGRRLEYDHPDKLMMDSNLETAVQHIAQTDTYMYFPWTRKVPFLVNYFQIHKAIRAYHNIREFFRREITAHVESWDPKHTRDLIDRYLVEMKANPDNETLTEDFLVGTLTDVFEAGSETTRVTLLWCVYCAAAFPETQRRVREDFLMLHGSDLRTCPYAYAFILEVMRWKTLVPLNVLHCTLADTTIGGYDVAKGTFVIANLWNAHHDPRHWDEPDTFRPERFLAEDGRTVRKPLHFMPFSAGKRACPGESMAYLEILLYLSALLKRFEISFPEGVKPDFAAQMSLNYRPKPFKVQLRSAPL